MSPLRVVQAKFARSTTDRPRPYVHSLAAEAVAFEVPDDRHQQGLAREAEVDKQLALIERIDLAIALAVVRIVPMVEHRAPMLEIGDRLDRLIDGAIDPINLRPARLG